MTKTALKTAAYAAKDKSSGLAPFTVDRREPGPNDVLIAIDYCGVCHSDIHQVRDEWGGSIFPMVPGHEIVGKITQVGNKVAQWKVGDIVGVGCFVDSCRECGSCRSGEEQYCEKGMNVTYNGREKDGKTPTYGGYSKQITVDENYVLRIPANLKPDAAAPLLCAGITTYSPLHHYGVKAGDKVGVVGLGGLGHMGVKIAKAMGAEVTVISHSPNKEEDAKRLGADHFLSTKDGKVFDEKAGTLDYLLDTVSAPHDYGQYLKLLKRDGTMMIVGVPDQPTPFHGASLVMQRKRLAGSLIGGIKETQEMLDFCGQHNITAEIELISIEKINEAYERMIKGDVHYRFVIDNKTIQG